MKTLKFSEEMKKKIRFRANQKNQEHIKKNYKSKLGDIFNNFKTISVLRRHLREKNMSKENQIVKI